MLPNRLGVQSWPHSEECHKVCAAVSFTMIAALGVTNADTNYGVRGLAPFSHTVCAAV